MPEPSTTARRWTGAIFLGIAIVMLVLGLTVLESRLPPFGFLIYWLTCIAFTLSAATIALMDASAIRQEAIREHRELIEETLHDIDDEQKKLRKQRPKDGTE